VFSLLRRYQPQNPFLAVVYWVAFAGAALIITLIGYYYLDKLVPQGGF
jgi:hypothetical protein